MDNLKIAVISDCDVIREGISTILSEQKSTIKLIEENTKEVASVVKKNAADLVVLGIDSMEVMAVIRDIKSLGNGTKLIILDFCSSSELFIDALKYGVDGYLLGRSSKEEITYAVNLVHQGKKYFDSYFVDRVLSKKSEVQSKTDKLTEREKEILFEIAKGMKNREISKKFGVSENTVKKHISNIFEKLKIKHRYEAEAYIGE